MNADLVVRDEKGNFVPDLSPEDIQVYEDGVLQTLSTMTVVTGGRVYNPMSAPVAAAPEGIILPTKRTVSVPVEMCWPVVHAFIRLGVAVSTRSIGTGVSGRRWPPTAPPSGTPCRGLCADAWFATPWGRSAGRR